MTLFQLNLDVVPMSDARWVISFNSIYEIDYLCELKRGV